MKNDTRGLSLIFGLMVGVVVFLLALALAPSLKSVTDEQRESPLLNCSTTSDSQIKAICTSIDLQNLFIAILVGIGGVIIVRTI